MSFDPRLLEGKKAGRVVKVKERKEEGRVVTALLG
jgi:hypothetical protein